MANVTERLRSKIQPPHELTYHLCSGRFLRGLAIAQDVENLLSVALEVPEEVTPFLLERLLING